MRTLGGLHDNTSAICQNCQSRVRKRLKVEAASKTCNARLQPLSFQKEEQSSMSPWPNLDLQELYKGAAGGRVRQHVNPLKSQYQSPTQAPEWSEVYSDPSSPLVLDVGCAAGRFLFEMAERQQRCNFLGLDIREPHIERALKWVNVSRQKDRLHFLSTNATVSLHSLLESYPGPIKLVTIQFPDPHFKKRHKKRRIVQPQFIADLAKLMAPQAHKTTIVVEAFPSIMEETSREADLEASSSPMQVDAAGGEPELTRQDRWANADYLPQNPLGVATEREFHTLCQGKEVYRVLLVRKERPVDIEESEFAVLHKSQTGQMDVP